MHKLKTSGFFLTVIITAISFLMIMIYKGKTGNDAVIAILEKENCRR